MSEARPITNITEYVCSQCWTSFGRDDVTPGAAWVTCPHCGHEMPADGGSVLDAVRAAPRTGDDSGGVAVPPAGDASAAPAVVASADGAAIAETFGGDHEPTDITAAPSGGAVAAPGAAVPDAIAAALAADDPPDDRTTAPTAAVRTTGQVAPGSLGGRVGDDDDDEVDFDDVSEKTLDRAMSLEELMAEAEAAVGAPALDGAFDAPTEESQPPVAVAAPTAAVRSSSSSIEAFEESGAFDPFAGGGADDPLAAAAAGVEGHVTASSDQLGVVSGGAVPHHAAAGPTAPDEAAVSSDGPADGGPPYEEREWKLRAFGGITYNFHGLDALLGWASSKVGSPMSVSVDGDEWRDFDPFYAALRDGLNAEQAYRAAGGEQVEAAKGSTVLDEIAAHDAAHPDAEPTVTRVTGDVPDEVRATAKRSLSRSTGRFDEVITESEKARRERGEPARRGNKKSRERSGRTGQFKSTQGATRAPRNTGSVRKAPAKGPRGGSKSGKRPAPDSDNRLAMGVGAALLITVVVVFILHQQGVVVLPFLPR